MKRKLCFILCLLLAVSLFSCADIGDVKDPADYTVETTVTVAEDTTADDVEKRPSKSKWGKLTHKSDDFSVDYLVTDADYVEKYKIDDSRILLLMRYNIDSTFPLHEYKIGVYNHAAREYEYLSEEIECVTELCVRSRYRTNGEYLIYTSVTFGGETVVLPLYYVLSENDGVWTLSKKEGDVPSADTKLEGGPETATSPDGSLYAYWESVPLEEKPGYHDNRTYIRDSSGVEREILPTEPWIDMYSAKAYKPSFFIDNDNLVLSVAYGDYGVYNISTDTFTEVQYEADFLLGPQIYKNGVIYSVSGYIDGAGPSARVFRDNGDGIPVEIQRDAETAEYIESAWLGLQLYSYFSNVEYGGYFYVEGETDGAKTTRIYSLDLELIAEISTTANYLGDEAGEEKNHGFIYGPDYVILIY